MNILFTPSDNDRYHGAFLCMANLAVILQKNYGYNVLVVLPYEGDGKELLDANNIRSVVIRSYNWLAPIRRLHNPITITKKFLQYIYNQKAIRQIERIIRTEKIDIVHNNTSWAYVGAAAAIRMNTPVVWHIREFVEEGQNLAIWNKHFGYSLMRKASRILTVSSSLYEKYRTLLKTDRISVVLDGVDPKRFVDRTHMIFHREQYRFLIVGGVYPVKRHEDIVRACIALVDEGFDRFVLDIAGDDRGKYADAMKALVGEKKLEDHIRFLGNIKDPERLYKEADITFMCSKYEGFGRVTVEAMMAGSLVIGAGNSGTLDLIQDGVTGLLYEPGDSNELKEKILYAIRHPIEMQDIAKRGQVEALARFTEEVNATNINAIYENILRKANGVST